MRDVRHQDRAHRVIQRALAHQRVPHAMLFAGPDGVGKQLMAVGFAKTMLCSQPLGKSQPEEGLLIPQAAEPSAGGLIDSCGVCQECRLVEAGTHPDLQIVYRQLNRQHPDSTIRKRKAIELGVDVIRHFLIDRAGTYPARGRAKVFIVCEAERMNDAAQNSLLKTLEEPPASTFIILLTTALDRMLATTRSRCQPVMFSPLPNVFVIERLNSLRPDAGVAEVSYAGRRAGGSLGVAVRMIDDGLFALKQPWGERLVELALGGRGFAPHAFAKPLAADAKSLADKVSEADPDVSDTDATRAGLQTLFGALGEFYADALKRATGANVGLANSDRETIIAELARLSPAALTAALRSLSEADYHLSRNANTELTLENLFINLAHARHETILV